ncbi:hypothetical protein LOZ65_001906 [Ophidiomyces ophidiicola]|nr:hypothetical protein LOZ65_001906 [Ophidiomyces ophidiicola]
MRRLILQGARWHQHGIYTRCMNPASRLKPTSCRLLSCSPKLQVRRPEVTIRHFEQSSLGSDDRREIDPDADTKAEEKFLKSKIAELEQELEEIKEEPFAPDSPLMRNLSKEDRAKALDALRKFEEEYNDEDDEDEMELNSSMDTSVDDLMNKEFKSLIAQENDLWDPNIKPEELSDVPKESFEVELTVPDAQQAFVARFNKTLKALHKNPTFSQRQDTWISYRRCKESLPFFLDIVPEDAIQMLWHSQIPQSTAERSRRLHWETLAEDILASGKGLNTSQWLQYLELLCQGGKFEKGIPLWEERAEDLRSYTPEELEKYLTIGVRLHVAADRPQRAQDIANAFLAANTTRDARILIPVLSSWARKPTEEAKEIAWALYLQVKTMLGSDITMEDYDSISLGLLNAGQTYLALAVFKDMMVTGQHSSCDSTDIFKASLGIYDGLHASSINASDVNKVSLAALTILPRKFQNKFFYASWMKKLIGLGEVDGAASVAELMYERGVRPDAKHLNGIAGAWLRQGSPSAKEKAEKLGWSMVQERINRVSQSKSNKPSIYEAKNSLNIPKHLQRAVPAANIETFSILLLYYTRQGQDDMIDHLQNCLEIAQLRPNVFFMNHLLYRELRRQNILGVWTKYREMTIDMKPDLETFACLYDTGKIQFDRTRYHFDANFPTVRFLYKEMMQWYIRLTPRQQNITRCEFSKELYDQIIRCFCLSLDPQGALVALRSMRQIFGFSPDSDTTRILTFLLVRLAPAPPGVPKPRRRRISATPRARENFESISRLLSVVQDWKTAGLPGCDINDLDEEDQKTFQMELMCDLLRIVMRQIRGNANKVESSIQQAAEEMNVGELDIGLPPDLEF